MNFDELNEIIQRDADVYICPICSTPYRPYHSRQKTCGANECKRVWHNRYLNERRRTKLTDDPEAFRESRREAEKKYRRKKKALKTAEVTYLRIEKYWNDYQQRHIETDGLEYGKKQMERTLASVPKIDVSGFERGNE